MEMIHVHISRVTPESREFVWDIISDIKNYSKYVTFMKEVKISEPPKVGTVWHDVVTTLWVPQPFEHVNIEWEPKKKFAFSIKLPFQGKMLQYYVIDDEKKGSKITIDIYFNLGNPLVQITIGRILSWRLHSMMETTIDRLQRLSREQQLEKGNS